MKSFSIENVKSFKNKTEIEIKPLTILVGRNSCGKSSLLRFPAVLSQTCDDDSQSPLQLYGKLIDYGTFNDVVFDHQGNDIAFTLKYDVVVNSSTFQSKKRSNNETQDIRTVEVSTHLGITNARLVVTNQRLLIDGKSVFETSVKDNNRKYKIYRVYDFQSKLFIDAEYEIVSGQDMDLGFVCCPPSGEKLRDCIKQQYFPKDDFAYDDERQRFYAEDMLFGETDDEEIKQLRNKIAHNTAATLATGPVGLAFALPALAIENKKMKRQLEEKTSLKSSEAELKFWYINDCFTYYHKLIDSIYQMCRYEMRMISYIGPFRQSPERIYRDTGSQQKKVGVKGEYASNVLIDDYSKNKTLIDSISEWLYKALGYKLVVANVAEGYFQLLLEDKNGIRSNISDVGYGISQILPIITQTLVSASSEEFFEKKDNYRLSEISIIEQPELHLHPAAQAELADLFAACICSNTNRKMLVETHSEHFIRKLQVLIADKNCEITANDVAIYYVDKNEKGEAFIDKLNILPNGQFEKEWPSGFFDKAFELSLELITKTSEN